MLEEIVTTAPSHFAAKMSLADCYARTGKLVSASRLYTILEQEAADDGQDRLRRTAAEKRSAIEPRISHLRVVVPEALSKSKQLVILHDGERIYPAQWGVSVPVDRGPHVIEARLGNETPWRKAVDIWQDGAIVEVAVDMAVPYYPGNVAAAPSNVPSSIPEPPKTPAQPKEFWSTGRILGVTTVGLGVVGLGLGIGFGAAAISKQDESKTFCNELNQCTLEGLVLRKDTMTRGNVSTAMFITGGILAAGGATLFLVSPNKGDARTPTVGVGPNGIVVSGKF